MFSTIINYTIKSKWTFFKPKAKPLLLIDGRFDPLKYYLKSDYYNILYRRGEEINFFIILKCLLQLDFTFKNYILNYIKTTKPRLLVTSIHNYVGFYRLSKLTGIKTMFIQSAIVTKWEICLGTKKLLTLKIRKFYRLYVGI